MQTKYHIMCVILRLMCPCSWHLRYILYVYYTNLYVSFSPDKFDSIEIPQTHKSCVFEFSFNFIMKVSFDEKWSLCFVYNLLIEVITEWCWMKSKRFDQLDRFDGQPKIVWASVSRSDLRRFHQTFSIYCIHHLLNDFPFSL